MNHCIRINATDCLAEPIFKNYYVPLALPLAIYSHPVLYNCKYDSTSDWYLKTHFYKYISSGDADNIELRKIEPVAEYVSPNLECGSVFEELLFHLKAIYRLNKAS